MKNSGCFAENNFINRMVICSRRNCMYIIRLILQAATISCSTLALAADYHVGPGQTYTAIGDVAWESLQAGDTVYIHARLMPYYEKWVLNRVGTANSPITVRGVPDANGTLPIIHGEGATTRTQLNYRNEDRGIMKIGSSNTPADGTPRFIVVENLHFRRARGAFTGSSTVQNYQLNAAGIYVEKGENITVRNCILEDNGNGLFVAYATTNMLVEGNYIFGNGNVNRYLEHNTYTEAHNILYQFNRFGPLCSGCDGNNLKDRSSGTVIRYNWIEGGNRQMDLVDAEGSAEIVAEPAYLQTHVYGNVLIEPDGTDNNQIVHFGGDSGTTADYRGTLYFWNNTLVSTRAGNTTLLRLSTNAQTAEVWNNILYVTAAGNRLALSDTAGTVRYGGNLYKSGLVASHSGVTGSVTNLGGNVTASSPGFVDEAQQDFRLLDTSPARNVAVSLPVDVAAYPLDHEYLKHQGWVTRPADANPDIGAFEYPVPQKTLNVTIKGSGTGSVASDAGHSGIACPDMCQASFADGAVVTLSHYPSITSVFSGWDGACVSDPCMVTMNAAKDVTATFNLAQVKNKTTATNYATIAAALSMAAEGDELLLLGMQYNGAVSLDSGITLNGGWDGTFGVKSGTLTMLSDGLTVVGGRSIADMLTVKGKLTIKGGSLLVRDVTVLP
jgi:parallel beta-helix repeat protein